MQDKYIFESVETVTGFDITDGSCFFILDELKDVTLENGINTVYGTGRNGVRLSAFDREKTAALSATNGYIVGGLLASQTGSEAVVDTDGGLLSPYFDKMKVGAGAATVITQFVAIGGVGAEIPWIYKANSDMSLGQKFTQAAAASATEFAYDPSTKEITLPTGVFEPGDVVIAFYEHAVSGKLYTNDAIASPKNARIVADVLLADICNNSLKTHAYLIFPNGKIDGNFSVAIGNDPATHAFKIEALQDICSIDKKLWDLLIVDEVA